ncbi:hypothetical protein EG329_012153 [Mollisiaceae sp. DMI_Dod_QoI]|nr:hypothetical protein EG329_012153 [Helotiales sp. DMI_Dod_QoI]
MCTTIIISLLALTASQVIAQYPPYYSNQSAPFNLYLRSSDSKLNGSAIVSCHEGAAIEGLCVAQAFNPPLSASTYNLNYSANAVPDPELGYTGLLTFVLGPGTINIYSAMAIFPNIATNLGLPLLEPSEDGTEVGFDQDNWMYIMGSSDHLTWQPYYRWYACTTVTSYTYQLLNWVYGDGQPENPTCYKVDVLRVFI